MSFNYQEMLNILKYNTKYIQLNLSSVTIKANAINKITIVKKIAKNDRYHKGII